MVFGLRTKKVHKETKTINKLSSDANSQKEEATEMSKKSEPKNDSGECPFC